MNEYKKVLRQVVGDEIDCTDVSDSKYFNDIVSVYQEKYQEATLGYFKKFLPLFCKKYPEQIPSQVRGPFFVIKDLYAIHDQVQGNETLSKQAKDIIATELAIQSHWLKLDSFNMQQFLDRFNEKKNYFCNRFSLIKLHSNIYEIYEYEKTQLANWEEREVYYCLIMENDGTLQFFINTSPKEFLTVIANLSTNQ